MWKVCQLLKSGRSHIRSRNANPLSSPNQPSSSTSIHFEENLELSRKCHRRPLAFTPSVFRSQFEQNNDQAVVRVRLSSSDDENTIKEEENFNEDHNFGREYNKNDGHRHRRPGFDHDRWHCRCRCRFGEWLSYTTMVAATIHLSRVTVHLLPNDQEKRDLHRLENIKKNGDRLSVLIDFKDAVQNGWRRFVYRTAPIFFPDLFKRFYVLPPSSHRVLALSSSQESGTNEENGEQASMQYDASSSSSASSTSIPTARTRSSSDDCAVQTDSTGVGTPFDDMIKESGRRLAALNRLTDVGLEHAIGVDFLKRQLYDEAIDYLLGAARSGHAAAMYNLGICYSRGYGVRRDMTKAVEMWRTAADAGHGLAKYQMGACHARGLGGLAMDFDRALRYMEAAAATGVPEAKTYLAAQAYKNGQLDGALDLLRQAIAGGDEKAKELLQEWNPGEKIGNTDGYTFTSLANEKSNQQQQPVTTKQKTNEGRKRFWASSSSEKEDSLSSSSSSSIVQNRKNDAINSSASIIFCDDESSGSVESKKATIIESGTRAIETVASLLTLGTLRRSRTAPEFRHYDNIQVAMATTGHGDEVDEV